MKTKACILLLSALFLFTPDLLYAGKHMLKQPKDRTVQKNIKKKSQQARKKSAKLQAKRKNIKYPFSWTYNH